MRGIVLGGMAALGIGGAAFTHGFGGGPDYERMIAKSPTAVYSAFDDIAEAGEYSEPSTTAGGIVTRRVKKVQSEEILYEALLNGKSVIKVDFHFAPVNGGAGTRLTADLDLDKATFAELIDEPTGKLRDVPDVFINAAFRKWMDKNVRNLEAGVPIEPLDRGHAMFAENSSVGTTSPEAAVEQRRWEAEEAQRKAAAPMVDPNEAARNYTRPTY